MQAWQNNQFIIDYKKCNRLISHLAFPINDSIISVNRPTARLTCMLLYPVYRDMYQIVFHCNTWIPPQ